MQIGMFYVELAAIQFEINIENIDPKKAYLKIIHVKLLDE